MRRNKVGAIAIAIALSWCLGMSAASAGPVSDRDRGPAGGGSESENNGCGASSAEEGQGTGGLDNGKDCGGQPGHHENNGCGAPSSDAGAGTGGLENGKDCGGDDESPDETPPAITSWSFSGTPGTSPWFTSGGTLAVHCTDDVDGDFAGSADPATLTGDGTHSAALTCTDQAGNTATARATVRIDSTLPTMAWSGDRTYDIDEMLAVSCAASDATSGVASTGCPAAVSDEAYNHIGSNTASASATDNAGNHAASSTSYQVVPTVDGSCRLISRFVANAGVANSLCVKIRNSQASAARGQATAELNLLAAYDREVSAQANKHIVAGGAPILLLISGYFRTH